MNDPDEQDELAAQLSEIARSVGGTLHLWPSPGPAVRDVVLRAVSDERGSQHEQAYLGEDGTLWVTGHDQGAGVSDFFGRDITSYEWIYVIAPDRVATLVRLLGGSDDADVLAILAAYHHRHGGVISDKLKDPQVAASFSTWHS